MKKLTLLLLLFYTSVAHAQNETTAQTIPAISTWKVYGYINNLRLDSIDAQYATFISKANGQIIFDYGQYPDARRKMVVTNEKNVPLSFSRSDYPFALNFLYYNGWELALTLPQANMPGDFILKKRTH